MDVPFDSDDDNAAAAAETTILRYTTPVADIGDALDLLAAVHGHDASGVLLDETGLPPAFFDLSTRFAGEFLQKLMNYHLQVALVVRDPDARSATFQQFFAEARHGRSFRTFDDEAGAVRWLEGKERGTDRRTRHDDEDHVRR